MSAPLPSSPRLRLVPGAHSPVAARRLSAVLPLQADWARILGDVTTLGQLHVEATNPAARLRIAAEPWTAHLAGPSAWLCGPGINFLALTDRWGVANIARDPAGHRYEHLDVYDRMGQRLLRNSGTVYLFPKNDRLRLLSIDGAITTVHGGTDERQDPARKTRWPKEKVQRRGNAH